MTTLEITLAILPLWLLVGMIIEARTNPFQHPTVLIWLLWPVLVVDILLSRTANRAKTNLGDTDD